MLYNRRRFIKSCVALYGSVLLLPGCNAGKNGKRYRCFTDDQAECIAAICEQIIPTDEYPGAIEAGVMNFIDKQVYQRFTGDKERYAEGVRALNAYCTETFGKAFAALDWERQTEVLQQMEADRLPGKHWEKIGQRRFFNLVRYHTMMGFYGAPHHGGNKDYVSFRMMKLDYPLLVGQNRYEK